MTRRHRGAVAVVAGALLSGLGIVDLVWGAGTESAPTATTVVAAPATTTTTPPAQTTTTTTAATSTTIEPLVGDVEEFVEKYRLALESDDVAFLFDWLHPGVKEGYGADLCRDWVAREIALLESYELTGPLIGPSSATISTDGGTFQVEGLYSGPIHFVYQGTEFEEQAQFVVEGGSIYWLGICR